MGLCFAEPDSSTGLAMEIREREWLHGLKRENGMNSNWEKREKARIQAGYYREHNYTWQYVLEPQEDQDILLQMVNGNKKDISLFCPKGDWTDFVRYKFGKAGADCDSGAAAMLTFKRIYTYLKDGEITPRPETNAEYSINLRAPARKYGGDTLTSALRIFKLYLYFLRQQANEEDEFCRWVSCTKKRHYVCIPADKDSSAYKNFNSYLYDRIDELAEPIGRMLSEDCKQFLSNVWNQGNMMPVPEFFNRARASFWYGDTVDRLLTYLYYYFLSNGDEKYLVLLLCNKRDNEDAVAKAKAWITEVCGEKKGKEAWNSFVEIPFLQPFCQLDEDDVYVPLCMYNGKPLQKGLKNPYDKKQLKFLPGSLQECESAFRTLNTAIQERSKLIQEAIHSKGAE